MNWRINTTLLFLFFTCMFVDAQNANSVWIFGDSAGIDFSNINNPLPIVSSMDGRGSSVSISDSNGSLISYGAVLGYLNTDWNTRVFNSQNQILQGCDSITGEAWYNELITIPRPAHLNQYYIFSVGLDAPNNEGCYYSLFDMSLNGGLGGVVQQNIQINSAKSGDCITAVKHGNGRDWWVINKYSSQTAPNHYNRFFIYLVTPDSIYPPITQDFNDATDVDFQKIVFNKKGTKFILVNGLGFMSQYAFDRCAGIISNPQLIYPQQTSNYNRRFNEGAYSINDSVFYVSTYGIFITETLYFLQYNLAAIDIPASCDTIDTFLIPTGTGAVRLAPDGKIYFSRAYEWGFPGYPYPDSVRNYVNENLSVINYPDSLGAACGYSPFSFYLGGKRTYYGLPNNPNYGLGRLVGSPCDTVWSGLIPGPSPVERGVLYVAPNPATKVIYFNAQHVKGKDAVITICNALGAVSFTKAIPVYSGGYATSRIDVSGFSSGIYFITLQTDKEIISTKFVKE